MNSSLLDTPIVQRMDRVNVAETKNVNYVYDNFGAFMRSQPAASTIGSGPAKGVVDFVKKLQ